MKKDKTVKSSKKVAPKKIVKKTCPKDTKVLAIRPATNSMEYIIRKKCEKPLCRGELISVGKTLNVTRFLHKCVRCGAKRYFTRFFPYAEATDKVKLANITSCGLTGVVRTANVVHQAHQEAKHRAISNYVNSQNDGIKYGSVALCVEEEVARSKQKTSSGLKINTLVGLFADEKRWCRNAYAKDKDGDCVWFDDLRAVSFSIEGGLNFCYADMRDREKIYACLTSAVKSMYPYSSIVSFNDCPNTGIEDIRTVVSWAEYILGLGGVGDG